MAAVIRLRQHGTKNAKRYRIILTDKRSPRDGKYKENLGWYNPSGKNEDNLYVRTERVDFWLEKGAQISEKADALVKRYKTKK